MKRMERSLLSISILALFTVGPGHAQEVRDLESWTTIGLEYEPHKKWSMGLEGQLRLDNNSSEIDEYFGQLEAEYMLFRGLGLGGGIRYIRENDNEGNVQGYENHFRFHLDAKYKHKIKDFSLGYRLRYQNRNELGLSTDDGDFTVQRVRLRGSLGYNIKGWKLDPKFSAELFNRFQNGGTNGFDKYRLTLGTEYKMRQFGKLGLFYRMEKDIDTDLPKTSHIIGLKYIYTLK